MIKLTKKEFKSGTLLSIANFYDPILLVIFTPIFIKNLTIEIYGLWVLIFSLANFARIGFAGINNAIVKFLANNVNKIIKQKFFINIIFLYLFYSLILLFSLIFSNLFIEFDNFFEIKLINNVGYFFIFSILFVLLKNFEEILYSVHNSYENYEISTFIKIISKTILFGSQIYCVISFKDVLILIEISCFVSIAINIIQLLIIKKKYNFINPIYSIILFEYKTIKDIIFYTKGLIINNLIGLISQNLDKLIISYFLGLKVLGLYNISFLIFSLIHSFFQSFFFYLFPKMSKVKNKNKKFRIFIQSEKNILVLGIITILFIYLISEKFIKIWLGSSFDLRVYEYHIIFLIINFLILPTIPVYYYLITFKSTMIQAEIALYNLILSTTLLIILGYYFSVYGIIFSKISGFIISIFQIIYIVKLNKNNVKVRKRI